MCAGSANASRPQVHNRAGLPCVQVMDFYWSDTERQRWDNLLTTAETLESGDFKHREQIVHWVRTFPFSFLSDRDYVIGRRGFVIDDVHYGVSKAVSYPAHDPGRLVKMDTYWSMWSCEKCPCPFGSGAALTHFRPVVVVA